MELVELEVLEEVLLVEVVVAAISLNTASTAGVLALAVVQVIVVSTAAVVVSSFTKPFILVDAFVIVLSSMKLFVELTVAPNVPALVSMANATAG